MVDYLTRKMVRLASLTEQVLDLVFEIADEAEKFDNRNGQALAEEMGLCEDRLRDIYNVSFGWIEAFAKDQVDWYDGEASK